MLEKCLRDVVVVDPKMYDQYAGAYRDDARRDLEIVVRNEAGRLTMECVGQKVQLFATSDVSFFVKQFYGEVTFNRDAEREVESLDFLMRVPNCEPHDSLHALKIY